MQRSVLFVLAFVVATASSAQAPRTAADSAHLAAAVAAWLTAANAPGQTRGPYVVRGDGRAADGTVWAEAVARVLRDSQPTALAASPDRETLRVLFGPVSFGGDSIIFRVSFNRCRPDQRIAYSGTSGEYAFRRESTRWVYIRPERMRVAVGDGFTCPW